MVLYEEGQNISFEFRPMPAFPSSTWIGADEAGCRNLLDNAVAAVDAVSEAGAEGQIIVETRLDPILNLVQIEVADNGCGVSPEVKPCFSSPISPQRSTGRDWGWRLSTPSFPTTTGTSGSKIIPAGARFIIEVARKKDLTIRTK